MRRSSAVLFVALWAAICLQANSQLCARGRTCGDCIGRVGCVWCSDLSFNFTRCIDSSAINSSSCNVVEDPSGSVGDTTTPPDPGTNPFSINNIDLNLRVGEPITFNMRVTALRNLPLDLYILMDLSSSMGSVLAAVQQISGQISQRIENITTNVRLGFGAFNEKVTSPFTTTASFAQANTEAPFAFRHLVDFTDNTTLFEEIVNSAAVTTNIDGAENGIEALAQVVLCDDELRWRRRDSTAVTRLILFMTNDGFHYAGEGKVAGILNPYRGNCLLEREAGDTQRFEFDRWIEVDYPSVGQIVDILTRQDVVVIFTVVPDLIPTYSELARLINQKFRASTAPLDIDGSAPEILNTVEEEYRRILREIRLIETNPSDQFTVSVEAMCPVNATLAASGDACDSVPLDSSVEFRVTVTLNSCEGLDNGATKTLNLEAPAFGSFTVTVAGVCNCACEEDQRVNSPLCSGNGNFTCGVCECNDGFCGPTCSLIPTGNTTTDVCPRGGPAFGSEICSNRGTCNCVCECDPDIFGEACECDTTSAQCKLSPDDSEVCSGRGTCCNRECTCGNSPLGNPYRGDSTTNVCQCEPVEEVCSLDRGTTCSGRGTCLCDSCDCLTGFGGSFCEIPTNELCRDEIDTSCIDSCRGLNPLPDYCMQPDCNRHRPLLFINRAAIAVNITANLEAHANTVLMHMTSDAIFSFAEECTYTRPNGCENDYYLLRNSTHVAVVVVREEDCPIGGLGALPIPIWAIAIIILGVLVILGILMIVIIKVIFIILDYIEVKKWQQEAREADFSKNQNPLYQSPEMKYENVAYGKE